MRKHPLKAPSKERSQVVFGATLRGFREEQGLTQEALAERADLHTNYVSSVERGERNLSLFNIVRLAYALNLDVSELVKTLDSRPQA